MNTAPTFSKYPHALQSGLKPALLWIVLHTLRLTWRACFIAVFYLVLTHEIGTSFDWPIGALFLGGVLAIIGKIAIRTWMDRLHPPRSYTAETAHQMPTELPELTVRILRAVLYWAGLSLLLPLITDEKNQAAVMSLLLIAAIFALGQTLRHCQNLGPEGPRQWAFVVVNLAECIVVPAMGQSLNPSLTQNAAFWHYAMFWATIGIVLLLLRWSLRSMFGFVTPTAYPVKAG